MNQTRANYVLAQSIGLESIKCIAVLTSIINVAVFSQKSIRHNPLLQYILFMSISDAIYTLSMTISTPMYAMCLLGLKNSKSGHVDQKACLLSSWYFYFIPNYFTSCLALFNIMIEILVTCQRIVMLSTYSRNKHNDQKESRPFIICAFLFVASLLAYSPVLFMNEVLTIVVRNETTGSVIRKEYSYDKTAFGKSAEAIFIEKALTLTRIGLVTCVLTVVNIIASIKFTTFFKQKYSLKYFLRERLNLWRNTHEYIADRRTTLMLISMSFLYIFGNLPYLVSYMIRLMYDERVVWPAVSGLYLLIILKTFVYYYFNTLFRKSINNFVVKLCRRFLK